MRNITIVDHSESYIQKMMARFDTERGRHYYSRRMGTVEPVFAQHHRDVTTTGTIALANTGQIMGRTAMKVHYVITGYAVDDHATSASVWSSTLVYARITYRHVSETVQSYEPQRTIKSSALHKWEWLTYWSRPGYTTARHNLTNSLSASIYMGRKVIG